MTMNMGRVTGRGVGLIGGDGPRAQRPTSDGPGICRRISAKEGGGSGLLEFA